MTKKIKIMMMVIKVSVLSPTNYLQNNYTKAKYI